MANGLIDTRQKNKVWRCVDPSGAISYEQASLAVLMDIRDELQGLRLEIESVNALLHCSNTIAIPKILRVIQKNTAKKPRKPAAPKAV